MGMDACEPCMKVVNAFPACFEAFPAWQLRSNLPCYSKGAAPVVISFALIPLL